MAETPLKRQREETYIDEDNEDPKRLKLYDHILSLLEQEEEEEEEDHHHHHHHPNQDLSSILTTLQREISCDPTASDHPLPLPISATDGGGDGGGDGDNLAVVSSSATSELGRASSHGEVNGVEEEEEEEEGEDEKERFMRRLLEASDDELGIPNRVGSGDDEGINGGDDLSLWELEDEAANYYTLFQSELFL